MYKVENALILTALCFFPALYSPTFPLIKNLDTDDFLGGIVLMTIKFSRDYIHIQSQLSMLAMVNMILIFFHLFTV